MKKKSFFRSFNAKLALAVLAVSGALLTGCSKDEGLDIEIPDVTIPQVDTKYQISGSVFDAETGDGLKATVTIDGAAVTVTANGGFTKEVTPGDRVIKVEMATFKTVTRTVSIAELPAKGYTAVYPVEIGLVKANPAETYVDAKYAAQVVAYLEDGSILAADKYAVEFKKGGAAVTDLANMTAGIYDFTVTPNDAAKYKPYTAKVNFANIKVPADSDAINVLVEAYIANVPVGPEPQPTITKLVANFIDKDGNFMNVTRAWLTKSTDLTTEVEGSVRQNVNHFAYEYEGEFKAGEYVLNYQFSKKDGSVQKGTKAFDAQNLISVEINVEGGATPPPAVVPIPDTSDSDVTVEIEGAGADVTMPKGLTATDANGNELEVMTIQRKTDEEAEEPAALRVFEGQPSGATFDPPLQVSFTDVAGGELGTMQLEYLKDGVWIKEADSDVELVNGKYVMNIAHFSEFRAATKVEITIGTAIDQAPSTKSFTINKENTSEAAVSIDYTYEVETGTEISDYATVVDTEFTSAFARNIVKAIIQAALESDGYVAKAWAMEPTTATYLLASKKKATTVDATYTRAEKLYSFIINGKNIVVTVTTSRTDLGEPTLVDIEHGHGNGSNAGGGSADGE